MPVHCPHHQQIKKRALEILEYDCPNNHTIAELRVSANMQLVGNTVAVAVCRARDQLSAKIREQHSPLPTKRNQLAAALRDIRPWFNKRNFHRVLSELIRDIRS